MITSEPAAPYADHLIRVPDTKSLLSPLLTLVPMQVFAAEFAMARGLDVDLRADSPALGRPAGELSGALAQIASAGGTGRPATAAGASPGSHRSDARRAGTFGGPVGRPAPGTRHGP